MHDETVETYTNVYARWFAIISQFIVTASLCTLWRLQMTRYSQVLVHSTVVNSRLSHQYMSISPFLWGFTAGFLELFLGFLQFQLLFARSFPAFWLGLGAVLVISESSPNLCVNSSSSYISPSMLPLSSGDLIEWSLVCHSILSYQRFYDLHSIHYDHLEGLHQLI